MRRHVHLLLLVLVTLIATAGFFVPPGTIGLLESLPTGTPELRSAELALRGHPLLDQVVVELSVPAGAEAQLPTLVSEWQERWRRESAVTLEEGKQWGAMAEAALAVPGTLSLHFDEAQLATDVAPRLTETAIRRALTQQVEGLASVEATGQAELIQLDPLALRDLVWGRWSQLWGGKGSWRDGAFYAPDGRSVLLTARPRGKAVDLDGAKEVQAVLDRTTSWLQERMPAARLEAVGTHRAMLDNERVARGELSRSVLWASLGVLLLVVLGFRHWWWGPVALLPAVGGLGLAMVTLRLAGFPVSVLALGFAGAIISMSVDGGLVFLAEVGSGVAPREVARRLTFPVWVAAGTTAGAFAALTFSELLVLRQLGWVASLGIVYAYILVFAFFPAFLPTVDEGRAPILPLDRFGLWLGKLPLRWGLGILAVLAVVTVLVARPVFRVDLNAMNAVSPQTRAAEVALAEHWGAGAAPIEVVVSASSASEAERRAQGVRRELEAAEAAGELKSPFLLTDLRPAGALASRRQATWRSFWTKTRLQAVRTTVEREAAALGLEVSSLQPFWDQVEGSTATPEKGRASSLAVPGRRAGEWVVLGRAEAGPRSISASTYRRLDEAGGALLPRGGFGDALSTALEGVSRRLVTWIAVALVLLLVVVYLDLTAVLIALLPPAAGLAAGWLWLGVRGAPMGLAELLVTVVILGMGVDAGVHLLAFHQERPPVRWGEVGALLQGLLLALGTTLIGFASLAGSAYPLAASAGSLGAIVLAALTLSVFCVQLPLIRHFWGRRRGWQGRSPEAIVARRYRVLLPLARQFAFFKLRLDPMFPRLLDLVGEPRRLLDVGCGYGTPATWLLAQRPELEVVGLDLDAARVAAASRAWGERGTALVGAAPELPTDHASFDVVMVLDVLHLLDDHKVRLTVERALALLAEGGHVLLRVTVPVSVRSTFHRLVEALIARRGGLAVTYRDRATWQRLFEESGAQVTVEETPGREETWYVLRPSTAASVS